MKIHLKMLCASLVLFFAFALPLNSNAAWNIQSVDAPKSFVAYIASIKSNSSRAIAVEKSTNNPHIVYGTDHLYHAYFNGTQWIYETLDDSPSVGISASIAIDANNAVHISYHDLTNGYLKYATNRLGQWENIIIDSGNVGLYSSIAVDSNGKVHIGYYDNTNLDLKYATNASGTWVTSTIDSPGDVGKSPSIAVDSVGNVHISYYDKTNLDLKYATNVSGIWVASTIDSTGDVGTCTSIAVGNNDKVHIGYYDNINYHLKYATNATGAWVASTIDSTSHAGDMASIAVDSGGKVHISYLQGFPFSLKYITNTSGSWVISTVDNTGTNAGYFTSIAFDSNNKIHISYYEWQNKDLRYATNASGAWVKKNIDSVGDVGSDPSIAVGSSNKIHISYYDTKNKDLKYATNASGPWAAAAIDSTGDVGMYSSIAVDSSNKVHISYYDLTNVDLKYATNATGTWVATTIDGTGSSAGHYTSLAVDSNKKVHISYYAAGVLKYATNATGSWVTAPIDSSSRESSIAVDSNNNVHISYYDMTNLDLKYATNATGSWVITPIDSTGDVGTSSSIAVDSSNRIHISYVGTGLKYATNASGSWAVVTIDNAGYVTQDTSIAVDGSDKIHISYYDWQPNYNLRYATNATGSWVTETIDITGDVGVNSSIAVDSGNGVHISYYDKTNADLKYATNALTDITPPIGTIKLNNNAANTGSTSVTLTLTCGDLQGTCSWMQFSNNGSAWSSSETYSATKLSWDMTNAAYGGTTEDGLKTVYVKFMDSSGNLSAPVSDTIILDTTGPGVSAAPGGATYGIPQLVSLTCTDNTGGSGCDRIYYTTNGTPPTTSSAIYTTPIPLDQQTTLRYFATDLLGNSGAPGSQSYTFTPGVTALSLDMSNPTINPSGSTALPNTLTVWGRLQNLSANGADPTGETIKLKIWDPKGVALTPLTTTVNDSYGDFQIPNINVFTQKGPYSIQAFYENTNSGLLSASQSTPMTVMVGASAGYAVIVVGKISTDPEGLKSHSKTAGRIYTHLKSRGFSDENIYYLSYQLSTGVDGIPSRANIQYAIEEWAAPRMKGVPAPLYVIMVDHGSTNAFYTGSETITPTDLSTWLSNLETNLMNGADANPEALKEKRIVIIGSCYSGSFMSSLTQAPTASNAGRMIITSAADNEVSYKGPEEPSEGGATIRSGEFFLEEFFSLLGNDKTFKEAFEEATARTEIFTRKGGTNPNANAPYYDGAVQHPQMEDNGDGTGSNTLSGDASGDGAEAANLKLGVANFGTNSALNPAVVTTVSGTIYRTSSAGDITALLTAKVNDNNEVDTAVWVEIRQPSLVLNPPADSIQQDLQLTKRPMTWNAGTSNWEYSFDQFTESGAYEIYYFVRDKDTKLLSPLKRSVVYKDRDNNPPPSAFSPVSPADGVDQLTTLVLDWGESTDADGLTYTVEIAKALPFSGSNIIYTKEEIPYSYTVIGPEAGLTDNKTYYWRVWAVDAYGAATRSNLNQAGGEWSFITNNPNDANGYLTGMVTDKTTGAAIVGAAITTTATGGPGPGLTVHTLPPGTDGSPGGHYFSQVPSVATDITVTATGYNPATVTNVLIGPYAVVTLNFSLTRPAVNGECGSSNTGTFTVKPATNLCNPGTPSTVSGSGPWTWTCAGTNGGSTSPTCTANIQTWTATAGGSAGGTISPASRTVNHGSSTTFTVTPNGGYTATMTGTCGGTPASGTSAFTYTTSAVTAACSVTATFTLTPVNGVCGSSNNKSFDTAPAVNLCNPGTPSIVSGSGPWTWTCAGSNGGSTSPTCTANLKTWTVSASGSAGGTISPASRTVNHGSATTFTVTPNSGYTAAMTGTCGGTPANGTSAFTYTTSAVTANCSVTATFTTAIAPTKIGIFDHGTWYLDSNQSWAWEGTPADTLGIFGVGLDGAIPVVGDWTGDGTTKIGVFIDGIWYLDMNRNWQWDGEPTDKRGVFGVGMTGAIPVVGDWTGDGITKIGVYLDGTWYLDMNNNWLWDGEPTDKIGVFGVGMTGEVPVVGDWNGDGIAEIGIYQDGIWYLDKNRNWQWDGE
ncbi:MAG: hypothetical protein EPN25_13895, partial [Nitrospirae bacterium]